MQLDQIGEVGEGALLLRDEESDMEHVHHALQKASIHDSTDMDAGQLDWLDCSLRLSHISAHTRHVARAGSVRVKAGAAVCPETLEEVR